MHKIYDFTHTLCPSIVDFVDKRERGGDPRLLRPFSEREPLSARPVIALDAEARSFCERFGFRAFSAREPLMPLLRISDLRAALGG